MVHQLNPPLTSYNKDEVSHEFLFGLEVLRLGRTVRIERLPLSSESAVMEAAWSGGWTLPEPIMVRLGTNTNFSLD